jgi:hypothetical protein
MFVRIDSERALASGPEAATEMIPDWDSIDIESLSDEELGREASDELDRETNGSGGSWYPVVPNRIVLGGDHQGRPFAHGYPPSDGVRSLSPDWQGLTMRTLDREQSDVTNKGVRLLLDAARYVEYASSPLSSQWSPLRSASSGHQVGSSSPSHLTSMRLTPPTFERY